MVEYKFSVYDHDTPPMVTATCIDDESGGLYAEVIPVPVPQGPASASSHAEHTGFMAGSVHSTNVDSFRDDTNSIDSTQNEQNRSQEQQQQQNGQGQEVVDEGSNRKVAAGVAGGIIGLFIGGPLLALIGGFGAAHYTEKEGAGGDIARAVGDIAIAAREKARELDEKHSLVDKSKQVACVTWEKGVARAKELDREHDIMEKTKEFAVFSLHAAAAAFQFLVNKLKNMDSNCDNGTRTATNRR